MSNIDKEFEETVKKINLKLKEAADALKEANRLSLNADLPGLIYTRSTRAELDYYNQDLTHEELDEKAKELQEKLSLIDYYELEAEISCSGWITSSNYC